MHLAELELGRGAGALGEGRISDYVAESLSDVEMECQRRHFLS